MPDDDSRTALSLLAPDGILHVEYSQVLDADQYLTLLAESDATDSVDALGNTLRALATRWHVVLLTEVVSRKP